MRGAPVQQDAEDIAAGDAGARWRRRRRRGGATRGGGGKGRNIYSQTVPGVPTTLGQVLLLSNTTQGHGWTFTYDVKRSFRNKFAFDVGYLYGQAFNAVESQSSVALTSWQNVFTPNDPNNTPVTTSDFDPGHRITIKCLLRSSRSGSSRC